MPPQSKAFGKTYGQWSVAWWQYVLAQPASTGPTADPTGAGCGTGQSGKVFFLAGTAGSGTATRNSCVVPAGKALFFPLVNSFDVHVPGDGLNTPTLAWNDLHETLGFAVRKANASIDGVPVRGLDPQRSPYRACAGPVAGCASPFDLTFNNDNGFGIPGGEYSPAVADGIYLLLHPLSRGEHTITFGGTGVLGDTFSQQTTYRLTVR